MNEKVHKQIKYLVETIVAYDEEKLQMLPPNSNALPNRQTIIEIIHLLREVLFPGYFGRQNLINMTKEYYIGDLLVIIYGKLHKQIGYALKRWSISNNEPLPDLDNKIDEIIHAFFSSIPGVRDALRSDVQAAFDGDPAAADKDEIIFSYPGLLAVNVYRLAHELFKLSVPMIPRIMTEYAHSITGIDIHPGATIGNYFFIDHGTGVVIGETALIGNRVKIYQGVTIGALSTREGQGLRGVKRHPTLEDDVTVYSGASILGGETVIGQGAVIGSNVFITKPVPCGTKVSVRSPELLFKGHVPQEFQQEFIPDWVI
jgi:serine O-acetyltransferase